MDGLILALALLLGTLLALGMSMAGLQLIISLVQAPSTEPEANGECAPQPRPQGT